MTTEEPLHHDVSSMFHYLHSFLGIEAVGSKRMSNLLIGTLLHKRKIHHWKWQFPNPLPSIICISCRIQATFFFMARVRRGFLAVVWLQSPSVVYSQCWIVLVDTLASTSGFSAFNSLLVTGGWLITILLSRFSVFSVAFLGCPSPFFCANTVSRSPCWTELHQITSTFGNSYLLHYLNHRLASFIHGDNLHLVDDG